VRKLFEKGITRYGSNVESSLWAYEWWWQKSEGGSTWEKWERYGDCHYQGPVRIRNDTWTKIKKFNLSFTILSFSLFSTSCILYNFPSLRFVRRSLCTEWGTCNNFFLLKFCLEDFYGEITYMHEYVCENFSIFFCAMSQYINVCQKLQKVDIGDSTHRKRRLAWCHLYQLSATLIFNNYFAQCNCSWDFFLVDFVVPLRTRRSWRRRHRTSTTPLLALQGTTKSTRKGNKCLLSFLASYLATITRSFSATVQMSI